MRHGWKRSVADIWLAVPSNVPPIFLHDIVINLDGH